MLQQISRITDSDLNLYVSFNAQGSLQQSVDYIYSINCKSM